MLRGDAELAVTQELLHKRGDVTAGNRDVLDAAADDIALRLACEQMMYMQEKGKNGKYSPQQSGILRTTGITWVTPSPESITVPVSVRSPTWRDVHEAARASTACTAMYSPVEMSTG